MIVKNNEKGWEVIFQPAHALLASKISNYLEKNWHTTNWLETKLAIAIHDDQKVSHQSGLSAYLTDKGTPRDFTQIAMDDLIRFKEVKSRLDNSYRKHNWIGLLASMHADSIYKKEELSKELSSLLDDEKNKRKLILKKIGLSNEELIKAYQAMSFSDRLSLILCQDEIPAMERKIEIITISDIQYQIWKNSDSDLIINPWPFVIENFSLDIETYNLEKIVFDNEEDLFRNIEKTSPIIKYWKISRT